MWKEEFVSLSPVSFFAIEGDCRSLPLQEKKIPSRQMEKYSLPDTSDLCHEYVFAKVAMGWNQEGVSVFVRVSQPFEQSFYPEVMRGDSVELFFDTRDVKTSGYNTRFCHHFFFLPKPIEGNQAGEVTRFRTEDMHPLCDPKDLFVEAQLRSSEYTMNIFIPNHCLNGYDPDQFDRMGFTYRINRSHGKSQHFSVVSDDYPIEQQPSLWGSLRLYH